MGVGTEGWTTGFISGMENLDDAIKMMSGMLNRFNRAEVFVGVGPDGEPTGISFSPEDPDKIRERMAEIMNRLPEVSVSEETYGGKTCIHISAVGYETPYSWKGWFYGRKCRPVRDGGGVRMEWTETMTCAMKRHRWDLILLSGDFRHK